MKKILTVFLSLAILFSASLGLSLTSVSAETDYSRCEQKVTNAWDNFETTVDISELRIPLNEINGIVDKILDNKSEYFYISGDYGYQYASNYVTALNFSFIDDADVSEIKAKKTVFDEKVESILSKIDSRWSVVDKLLYLHDYIALNNVYDVRVYTGEDNSDSPWIYSAYGCLVDEFSVCQGISKAFMYLCEKIGVEAHSVKSTELMHEWNIVKIGYNFYHIDITWDAPLIYEPELDFYYSYNGNVRHDSFLLSDEQVRIEDHTSWNSIPYRATDGATYSRAFWKSVSGAVSFVGDNQYFLNSNNILKRNIATGVISLYHTIENEQWTADNNYRYHWMGYTALVSENANENCIYFSTANNVYKKNLSDNSIAKIFTMPYATGYISGMKYKNGKIHYDITDYIGEEDYLSFKLDRVFDANAPAVTLGDVNGDGDVNVQDVLDLRRYLAKFENTINPSADINNDGVINMTDVLAFRKMLSL